MRGRVRHLPYAAVLLAAAAILIAPARAARAQVVAPELAHLKCYRIRDSLQPTRYIADLRNQFGLEPGCMIGVPARLFCAETSKLILPPVPPGGGAARTPGGAFLLFPGAV